MFSQALPQLLMTTLQSGSGPQSPYRHVPDLCCLPLCIQSSHPVSVIADFDVTSRVLGPVTLVDFGQWGAWQGIRRREGTEVWVFIPPVSLLKKLPKRAMNLNQRSLLFSKQPVL